MIENHKL